MQVGSTILRIALSVGIVVLATVGPVAARTSAEAIQYNNAGVRALNKGLTKVALGFFDRAIKLDEEYDLAYSNRSIAKFRLSDFNGSLADLDTCIESMERKGDCLYGSTLFEHRAKLKKVLGDSEGAAKDFAEAKLRKPNDALRYFEQAEHELNKGQLKLAREYADMSIEFDSEKPEYFKLRAKIHQALGSKDAAQKDLKAAKELERDSAPIEQDASGGLP